jgi:peptidoglycan/LPS O-acetylase OafA/YrhL
MLQNSEFQNNRLLGIDLFRGIAAYGVVIIHGLGEMHRDGNALMLSNFLVACCVPFFLITSFYFLVSNLFLYKNKKNYLFGRMKRILIPYLAWSLIYFFARLFGWILVNDKTFNKLILDPVNLIFFGASGVQLYFLPMLFFGTLFTIFIFYFIKKIQNNLLLYLYLFISICLSQFIIRSGNDFVLGEGIAFKQMINISIFSNYWLFQFMRLIFVVIAWIIKCLPFIIFSIILNKSLSPKLIHQYIGLRQKSFVLLITPLFIVTIFIYRIQFLDLFIPYILFIYAILISELISKYSSIRLISIKLGYYSFGIYLVHALLTAGFMPVMVKSYPQVLSFQLSPLTLSMSSAVIFVVSLAITHFISLNKTAAKILLAI